MLKHELNDVWMVFETYHKNLTLGNTEIKQIFRGNGKDGVISSATVAKRKKEVFDYQNENAIHNPTNKRVCRKTAFEVWGIDIREIERSCAVLHRLGRGSGKQEAGK